MATALAVLGGSGLAAVAAVATAPDPATSTAALPPTDIATDPAVEDTATTAAPTTTTSSPPTAKAPSTVPTPAATGPVAVAGALFDSAVGRFTSHFDNSDNDGLVQEAEPPTVVAHPDAPGRSAWRFFLDGGGKRSEVLPQGPGTEPTDGDEQYIRYSAILGKGFPTDTESWQLLLQWHHDSPDGSPPLALQVTDGQLMMVSGGDDKQAIGPVSPGQPVNLTMHVVFSQDPDEGTVTVWRDGRPTGVTDWHPRRGTMSTRTAYLKMGMYRDPGIDEAGSVTVTDLKIARDREGIGGTGRPAPTASP